MPTSRPAEVPPRVTLLTDFGTVDGYVAEMKGVIATRAALTIIDDVSHDIAPGDVHGAAWAVAGYWRRYPAGAVHIVVVDPGVGGPRRALAVAADGRVLVGPDNGVFSRVLHDAGDARVVAIADAALPSTAVSATFHGRDVFAPAAAHLALGNPIDDLGSSIADAVMLDLPLPARHGDRVHGVVVHVDRFGNLITNIDAGAVHGPARVIISGVACRLARTYAEAERGALIAVVGSRGLLEVAVRDGSAAARLNVRRGEAAVVEPAER